MLLRYVKPSAVLVKYSYSRNSLSAPMLIKQSRVCMFFYSNTIEVVVLYHLFPCATRQELSTV